MKTTAGKVVEIVLVSETNYAHPFNEIQQQAVFQTPSGAELVVPGFWDGGNVWKIRYSSQEIGMHRFRTECSNSINKQLHHIQGSIEVEPYTGENALYKHGPIEASEDRRYLQHQDGTPFFWLADTWWMAFSSRLRWPDDYQRLVQDRVDKQLTVIQLVAGFFPDMEPNDPRCANDGGLPWNENFDTINPLYFQEADRKFEYLVENGIVPCMMGSWGYYLDLLGSDVIKLHWRYLLARYSAYPLIWCLAGEAVMPYYLKRDIDREVYIEQIRKEWTDVAEFIRSLDPFNRALTVHPTDYGRDMVSDTSIIDFEMLQTGHSSYRSLDRTVRMVQESVQKQPRLPVINSEVCYEGIAGSSHADVQRFTIWSCLLNGACGHTYGADGLWQANTEEEIFGPSPHGMTWSITPWKEAADYTGSTQIGYAKNLLKKYEWWRFETRSDWWTFANMEAWLAGGGKDSRIAPVAAGIPGEVRVIFLPILAGCGWNPVTVTKIEAGVQYRAYYYDPIRGEEQLIGHAQANADGTWTAPRSKIYQDWVLVLEQLDAENLEKKG